MEVATVKAAKFHSWAVGHPIDCELTVIEHDWVLLQRRDTGPGVCLGHSEHRCSVAIEGKHTMKACFKTNPENRLSVDCLSCMGVASSGGKL